MDPLLSGDIGLAAAGNAAKLRVRRKPHVVLFTTGDELVLPGERPRPDQIICFRAISYEDGLVGGGGIAQTGIVGPGKTALLVFGKATAGLAAKKEVLQEIWTTCPIV